MLEQVERGWNRGWNRGGRAGALNSRTWRLFAAVRRLLYRPSMTDHNDLRHLVQDHLPLVRSIAGRLYRKLDRRIELDELVSIGTLGLIQAARRYDGRPGVSFATYAYRRIQGAMLDGVGQLGPLPRGTWRRRPDLYVGPLSQEPAGADRQADEALDQRRAASRLVRALQRLPERKRQLILRCYYGEISLQDAGRELGVSKSWASRLHTQTLGDLRRELRAEAA